MVAAVTEVEAEDATMMMGRVAADITISEVTATDRAPMVEAVATASMAAAGGGYGQQSAGGYGTGAAQSPQAAQAPAVDPAEQQRQVAAWTAYYAANPHEDPYAQYGGYGTMMQYYYSQGQGQPQGQPGYAQSPIQQQGQNGAPPPPPPPDDSSAPPPPPPPGSASGGGAGGYNAVSEDIYETENLRIYLTHGLKMPPPPGM